MKATPTYYPVFPARALPSTHPVADEESAPYAGMYTAGMRGALELSRYWVESSICATALLMDMYRHLFWYPMGLEYWFRAQEKAYAYWVDFGAEWMKISADRRRFTRAAHEPTPRQAAEQADKAQRGMDTVVGAFDDEILA